MPIMKRQHALTLLIALFLSIISFHGVSAAGALDFNSTRCGDSNPNCSPSNFFGTLKTGFSWIVAFSATFITVLILFYLAWGPVKAMLAGGKPEVISEYRSKATGAVISFAVLVATFGLAYWLMSALGVSQWILKVFQPLFSTELIPHAYAETGEYFSSPIEGTDTLYDFLLLLVRLLVRWFIYPAIIAMWIYTGFSYVAAQGNPEKITKSHKWLFIAVATTVISFLAESFMFAIRDTVNAILG